MEENRKDEKRKSGFLYKIRNRQFQRLFFRNWIQVFACIVLPLMLCIEVIRYFSAESLIKEVDFAARRSTNNTMVTLEALLGEVCDSLEKKAADESFVSFFQMERREPQKYDYVATVNSVLKQIIADYRDNLFDSVDVYSQVGDYVISTPHKGQSYERFADKSLVETFFDYVWEGWSQVLFAAPRFAIQGNDVTAKRVITIYQKGFVSASMDTEKLVSYITDEHDRFEGAYLIVDRNDRVVLDTSGQMNDAYIALSADAESSAVTAEVDGQTMRIFWMPM